MSDGQQNGFDGRSLIRQAMGEADIGPAPVQERV